MQKEHTPDFSKQKLQDNVGLIPGSSDMTVLTFHFDKYVFFYGLENIGTATSNFPF